MVAAMGRAEVPRVGQQCPTWESQLSPGSVVYATVFGLGPGGVSLALWSQTHSWLLPNLLPLSTAFQLIAWAALILATNSFSVQNQPRVSLWLNWKSWTATDNTAVQAELFAACHCVKFSPIPGNSQPSIVSTAVPSYLQKVPHIVRHYVSHLGWWLFHDSVSYILCVSSLKAKNLKPKLLTVWITTNRQILKEMGISDHLTCLLRNLYAGQEATELDMQQQTGSKSGKEFVKVVDCHPAYLTSMQSTSWKTLAGWSTSWNQQFWEKYQ